MQETQETQVGFLGWEDPLEKAWLPTRFLAQRTPWIEEPGQGGGAGATVHKVTNGY